MLRTYIAIGLLIYVAATGVVLHTVVALVVFHGERDPDKRAILCMGLGLIIIWCILGGTIMRLVREPFKALMARVRIHWTVKFVLLCIAMALLEEAVTVSMTNLAPIFGGVTEAAHITAYKGYLETVCLDSVIVFVPQFMCWAFLLWLWDFKPVEVMLLYGLTGWVMEALHSGPDNWNAVGMWTFVYGLMVYLPACTVPPDRKAWPVRWWTWPVGTISGLLAIVLGLPLAPLVWLLHWLIGPVHKLGG